MINSIKGKTQQKMKRSLDKSTVFLCTFVRRSLHFFGEFFLSFPIYWVIHTSVLSFPHGYFMLNSPSPQSFMIINHSTKGFSF